MALRSASKHDVAWRSASKHGMTLRSASKHGMTLRSASKHDMTLRSASKHDMALRSASKHDMALRSASKHDMALRSASKHDMAWGSASKHDTRRRRTGVFMPRIAVEPETTESSASSAIELELSLDDLGISEIEGMGFFNMKPLYSPGRLGEEFEAEPRRFAKVESWIQPSSSSHRVNNDPFLQIIKMREEHWDKVIKKKQEAINGRVTRLINAWQVHNKVKLLPDGSIDCYMPDFGHFPVGFGVFLCPEHMYTKQSEPELSKIYDVISQVEDATVRDELLSFLYDFQVQDRLLGELKPVRAPLLLEVQSWLRVQKYNQLFKSNRTPGARMSLVMMADGLRDVYMNAAMGLENLVYIRKKLDNLERRQKKARLLVKQSSTRSMSSRRHLDTKRPSIRRGSSMGYSSKKGGSTKKALSKTGTGSDLAINPLKGPTSSSLTAHNLARELLSESDLETLHPAVADILRAINRARVVNSSGLDKFEKKVLEASEVLQMYELSIESIRGMAQKKRSELQNVQEKQVKAELDVTILKDRLEVLLHPTADVGVEANFPGNKPVPIANIPAGRQGHKLSESIRQNKAATQGNMANSQNRSNSSNDNPKGRPDASNNNPWNQFDALNSQSNASEATNSQNNATNSPNACNATNSQSSASDATNSQSNTTNSRSNASGATNSQSNATNSQSNASNATNSQSNASTATNGQSNASDATNSQRNATKSQMNNRTKSQGDTASCGTGTDEKPGEMKRKNTDSKDSREDRERLATSCENVEQQECDKHDIWDYYSKNDVTPHNKNWDRNKAKATSEADKNSDNRNANKTEPEVKNKNANKNGGHETNKTANKNGSHENDKNANKTKPEDNNKPKQQARNKNTNKNDGNEGNIDDEYDESYVEVDIGDLEQNPQEDRDRSSSRSASGSRSRSGSGCEDTYEEIIDKNVIPEMASKELFILVSLFLDRSMEHLGELEENLLQLRVEARIAMAEISDREVKVRELSCNLERTVRKFEDTEANLPVIEAYGDKVELILPPLRHPHRCRMCMCHDNNNTLLIDSREAAKAAGRTLAQCNKYAIMLVNLKFQYSNVCRMLQKTENYITQQLEDIMWVRGKEADHTELGNLAEETDCKIVDVCQEVEMLPCRTIWNALEKAKSASNVISLLTVRIIAIAGEASERLSDIRSQCMFLDEVEEQLETADRLIQHAAISLARGPRVHDKFLRSGKLLRDCVCPYCSCYNSPFDDGARRMRCNFDARPPKEKQDTDKPEKEKPDKPLSRKPKSKAKKGAGKPKPPKCNAKSSGLIEMSLDEADVPEQLRNSIVYALSKIKQGVAAVMVAKKEEATSVLKRMTPIMGMDKNCMFSGPMGSHATSMLLFGRGSVYQQRGMASVNFSPSARGFNSDGSIPQWVVLDNLDSMKPVSAVDPEEVLSVVDEAHFKLKLILEAETAPIGQAVTLSTSELPGSSAPVDVQRSTSPGDVESSSSPPKVHRKSYVHSTSPTEKSKEKKASSGGVVRVSPPPDLHRTDTASSDKTSSSDGRAHITANSSAPSEDYSVCISGPNTEFEDSSNSDELAASD